MQHDIRLLAAFLLFAAQASAETLRCGSKIVDVGMTTVEVRKYCGEPTSAEIEEHDVRAGNRVVGKTQLNIWYYRRSAGQRTAILKFDRDKLMSISYASK